VKETYDATWWGRHQEEAYRIAQAHGWNSERQSDGEVIALMHSELSEALEHLRHGDRLSDHIPDFSGVEEEFADVVIRIMHRAHAKGYRIREAVEAKMKFNHERPYKHGGKKF